MIFKRFGGVVLDGDPPDVIELSKRPGIAVPARKLVNLDIDKTSQQLVCRHPFYEYDDLAPTQGAGPNVMVSPGANYELVEILKWSVGVVAPQYNTMAIFRSKQKTGDTWDWVIYDNGPAGGDGNSMVKIAEEKQCTHCKPVAALGKVRITLGNGTKMKLDQSGLIEANYRIYMPHTHVEYFSAYTYPSGTIFQIDSMDDLETKVETYQNGYYFKTGEVVNSVTITKPYLYLDGRLYTEWQETTPSTDYLASRVKLSKMGQSASGLDADSLADAVLPRGEYKIAAVPFFDTDVVQIGAPIFNGSLTIDSDPVVQSPNATEVLTNGHSYGIEFEIQYPSTASQADILQWRQYCERYFRVEYGTSNYYNGDYFIFDPAEGTTYRFAYHDGSNWLGAGSIPASGTRSATGDNLYGIALAYSTNSNGGDHNDVPQTFVYNLDGFYVGPTLIRTPGWSLKIKVKAVGKVDGSTCTIDLGLSLNLFNPRLTKLGIFVQRTVDGLPTPYVLADEINIREDSGDWYIDPTDTTIIRVIRVINNKTLTKSKGFWDALAEVDGVSIRPISHTEKDITRQMAFMVPQRNRMHGAKVDGDEGQEMVARTPISAGQPQFDVWFRPLVQPVSKGQAVTHMMEFHDRLLWFTDYTIYVGTFGDSRRSSDYQFVSTGGNAGTSLIRTVARSNDGVFFANYYAIWKFNGQPIEISLGRISDYWRYTYSKTQKDLAFGGFNRGTNEYWLCVPKGTITGSESVGFSWSEYDLWIWDDTRVTGETWRQYTLDTGNTNELPKIFFGDRKENWIFATSENFLYFFSKEKSTNAPIYPIAFEWQSPEIGEREYDIMAEKIRVQTEPTSWVDLTASIYRSESTTASESLTIKSPQKFVSGRTDYTTDRQSRKLDRERTNTIRVGISGSYTDPLILDPTNSPTSSHYPTRTQIREVDFDFILDKKRS